MIVPGGSVISWFRDMVAWRRSEGRDDTRLHGSWVPEPTEPGYPYLVSYVFQPGVRWPIARDEHGLHQGPADYRVPSPGSILVRSVTGWSRIAVRFESDDVLVIRDRRYRRASHPDDRAWPPEFDQ
jgi:hypothetical protein